MMQNQTFTAEPKTEQQALTWLGVRPMRFHDMAIDLAEYISELNEVPAPEPTPEPEVIERRVTIGGEVGEWTVQPFKSWQDLMQDAKKNGILDGDYAKWEIYDTVIEYRRNWKPEPSPEPEIMTRVTYTSETPAEWSSYTFESWAQLLERAARIQNRTSADDERENVSITLEHLAANDIKFRVMPRRTDGGFGNNGADFTVEYRRQAPVMVTYLADEYYKTEISEEANESFVDRVRYHLQDGDGIFIGWSNDFKAWDCFDFFTHQAPFIVIGERPNMALITDVIVQDLKPYDSDYPDAEELRFTYIITQRGGQAKIVGYVRLSEEQFI